MFEIAPLDDENVSELIRHVNRHFKESHKEKDPFTPMPKDFSLEIDTFSAQTKEFINRDIQVPGWKRFWIAKKDGVVLGHADLSGEELPSAIHRCWFGIGIEQEARSCGLGKALMSEVLKWAKTQSQIDTIYLNVFSINRPAIELYKKFGFKIEYVKKDWFRLNEQSIDDITMCLNLKNVHQT